jgi:hypothetical protein
VTTIARGPVYRLGGVAWGLKRLRHMKLIDFRKLIDPGGSSYPIWCPERIWIRNCFMKLLEVGNTRGSVAKGVRAVALDVGVSRNNR